MMNQPKMRLWMLFFSLTFFSAALAQSTIGNRAVVAIPSGDHIFISWRLLETDPAEAGFNIYRSNQEETRVKLNYLPLTQGTNFVDRSADLAKSNVYEVVPINPDGTEFRPSNARTAGANAVTAAQANVITVNLRSGRYIHFCWAGDLDGDGDNDYVIDRHGDGSSIADKIEAYTNTGSFLWEVDYGPNSLNRDNISPGSAAVDVGHWDGVTVADLNGDGRAEVITKIADGVRFGNGEVWTHSNDNRQWLAVLDGMTGARLRYSSIPQDYLSVGPVACQLGIGNGNEIFMHAKNRNSDGSFNVIDACYRFTSSGLSLRWSRTGGGPNGHQIRVIDVNGDGVDDLAHIGYVLNGSDGNTIYQLPGIVHGDRWHIGKFDPNRSGLQGYGVQQDNGNGIVEYYYDATTGQMLWTHVVGPPGYDNGRGNAADIDPRYDGYEVWSFEGIYNGPSNNKLTNEPDRPWPNFRLWWDGDNGSELYDNGKIEAWDYSSSTTQRLVTCSDYGAVGSSRGAPLFYGDIMGDWREEVILKNSSNSQLIIFTTDIPTSISRPPLTTDQYYRNCLTTKGYMQSHHVSYYLGEGGSTPPPPSGGNYVQLRNRGTGLYVDGVGRTTNGDACAQWANTNHINSHWEMIDVGGGYYQLRNGGTGLYLDGLGRTTNGADCGMWANTTHQNSHWSVQQYTGNYYRIQNRTTGLYLDGMGRTANGSACGQWGSTSHSNAQWELINVSARSGSELTSDQDLVVYPNPVDGKGDITIQMSLPSDSDVRVTIYAVSGQKVYDQDLGNYVQGPFSHTIQTGGYREGIYLLTLQLSDQKITKSIIVK